MAGMPAPPEERSVFPSFFPGKRSAKKTKQDVSDEALAWAILRNFGGRCVRACVVSCVEWGGGSAMCVALPVYGAPGCKIEFMSPPTYRILQCYRATESLQNLNVVS